MKNVMTDFGAVGDGVADDSGPVQAALYDADPDILFPAGHAFRCAQLLVPGNKNLHLAGATLTTPNVGPNGKSWIAATLPGAQGVRVLGGRLIGQSVNPVPPSGFFIGWRWDQARRCLMREVEGSGFATDVSHAGGNAPCEDLLFQDCTFMGSGRNNLSIVNAQRVMVLDCIFSSTTGNNPGAGIDIEPNAAERVDDITVQRCRVIDCSVGIYDQRGQGMMGVKHRLIDNEVIGSRRIGIVANSISDLIVAGNYVEGPPVYAGPAQQLTIGISVGGFSETSRANDFSIRKNIVRGHTRHLVLAGVADGEVVNNDAKPPEYPALGLGKRVLLADNFLRA